MELVIWRWRGRGSGIWQMIEMCGFGDWCVGMMYTASWTLRGWILADGKDQRTRRNGLYRKGTIVFCFMYNSPYRLGVASAAPVYMSCQHYVYPRATHRIEYIRRLLPVVSRHLHDPVAHPSHFFLLFYFLGQFHINKPLATIPWWQTFFHPKLPHNNQNFTNKSVLHSKHYN